MQKRVAFCLTAAVLLLFLGGCRQGTDSGSHLVAVDAEAVPAAAAAEHATSSGGASPASSAASAHASRTGSAAAFSAGTAGSSASGGDSGSAVSSRTGGTGSSVGGGESSASSRADPPASGGDSGSAVSSRTGGTGSSAGGGQSSASSRPDPSSPDSSGSSAAPSATGSGGSSAPSDSGQAASRGPTLTDGADAVNAAFALADAQPAVVFRFTDTLEGGSPQTGTVRYNNRPSVPVFTQNERLAGTGVVTETAVCCDGTTVTGTASSGSRWTRPLAADDVTRYVRLLTPRLAAGRLSEGQARRQDDGSLTLQAQDAAGEYGAAAVMAGLPDARVTAVWVSYTVRADGRLGASTQRFTLRTDSGTRVFTMEKQYQW